MKNFALGAFVGAGLTLGALWLKNEMNAKKATSAEEKPFREPSPESGESKLKGLGSSVVIV